MSHPHPSMQDLFSYPLMAALTERRTRRIPRGFSVNAGPLTHRSENEPAPLTPVRGTRAARDPGDASPGWGVGRPDRTPERDRCDAAARGGTPL